MLITSSCSLPSYACLSRAGVILRALSTQWQTITVTDASVTSDVHQTLDVRLHL